MSGFSIRAEFGEVGDQRKSQGGAQAFHLMGAQVQIVAGDVKALGPNAGARGEQMADFFGEPRAEVGGEHMQRGLRAGHERRRDVHRAAQLGLQEVRRGDGVLRSRGRH